MGWGVGRVCEGEYHRSPWFLSSHNKNSLGKQYHWQPYLEDFFAAELQRLPLKEKEGEKVLMKCHRSPLFS